jgi:hypothetical protein
MSNQRTKSNKSDGAIYGASSATHCISADDVLMQPWFLPKRIADAIRGMVPHSYRSRMRYYFEDYGCMICGCESLYHSNGMCLRCFKRILSRIKKSFARRARTNVQPRLDLVLFRQQKLAKSLLKDLTPENKAPAQRLTLQMYRGMNPVYEAFSAFRE